MIYWVAITTFIGIVSSQTALTYNNCPTQFNPKDHNSSLYTSYSSLANSIYGNAFSEQAEDRLRKQYTKGNLDAVYEEIASVSFLLPFIIVAAIWTVIFCGACCCSTFQKRCPPCESWRRNWVKQPYKIWELRCTMGAGIFFSVAVLITTIVGFSTFSSLHQQTDLTRCSMYYTLDVSLNGYPEGQWGGFSQVQTQLSDVVSQLNSTITAAAALANNEWIRTQFTHIQEMNLALYTNNKDSVVPTPDPIATETALNASTSIPTVTPLFISSGLGPNGTAGTMVSDIDSGFRTSQQFVDQAYLSYQAANGLSNSAENISTTTATNLESITLAVSYLSSIQIAIQEFDRRVLKSIDEEYLYIAEGIYGGMLLASLLLLLAILATHTFGILGCAGLVKGAWILMGLVYLGVIVVLAGLIGLGGGTYTYCEYLNSLLSARSQFVTFSQQSSGGAFNKFFRYMDGCFFDDGNILDKFSVARQINTVSQVFTSIQKAINMRTLGNAEYVDVTQVQGKILGWMSVMLKYGDGVYIDSILNNEDNPYISLANMNKYTDSIYQGNNSVLCSRDYWTFDITNCTYGISQSIYTPGTTDQLGLYFPPTGTLCISFNSRISQTAPSIWKTSDIANRYLSIKQCGGTSSNAYDKVLQYSRSLTNYRDGRINLYQSLSQQLNDLLTTVTNYNTNLTTFTSALNTFSSSAATLSNTVTNQINGLTITSNCTVIADSLRFHRNVYCTNFLNRTVTLVLTSAALLVLCVFAVLLGALVAVRYQRVQKLQKLQGVDHLFKSEDLSQSEHTVTASSQESDKEGEI